MIFKTLLTSAAVSLAVASYAQAAVQDGTFEGTANGKNGPVTVAVTIKAGKITNVKVVKSGESAMIGDGGKSNWTISHLKWLKELVRNRCPPVPAGK